MFGSFLGLIFPAMTLLISPPLLGLNALGGAEPYSLFSMRPLNHYRAEGYDLTLSIPEPTCPGEPAFRRLEQSSLPEDGAGLSYDGLVACVLSAPNGGVVRVRIMDAEGKRVTEPGLESFIVSNWRFEVKADWNAETAWQPVRLDGLRDHPAPLGH